MDHGDEAIEPLLKYRKRIDDIETEKGWLSRDELGRNLSTGQAVSGIKVA
jgi:hypothetical protein